jgi:hypothetical protein
MLTNRGAAHNIPEWVLLEMAAALVGLTIVT